MDDQEATQEMYDCAVGAVLAQLEDLTSTMAIDVLRDVLNSMIEWDAKHGR